MNSLNVLAKTVSIHLEWLRGNGMGRVKMCEFFSDTLYFCNTSANFEHVAYTARWREVARSIVGLFVVVATRTKTR